MGTHSSPLTLLRMTTRQLYRRPMRTTLTVLGVSLGVVAIVALSTMVRGMWITVDDWIHLGNTDLIVFRGDVAGDIFSILEEEETRAKLVAVPGVADAVGTLWHILPVEDQPFMFAEGLRLEDMRTRFEGRLRGRLPEADDELALGSIAQRALNKDLGDTVIIQGEALRVVGVFSTGVVFSDGALLVPLPRLQHLAAREGRVTAFQLCVREGADIAAVAEEIERRHPQLVAIADVSEYNKVDQGLEIIQSMVWMITFMAVILGSIIVANTMWMAVLERTRQIGILRGVGWSRRRIVAVIMLEALGVGVLACLVGSALGVALSLLTARLPVSEQFIEPMFDTYPFVLALGVALLLSAVGALLPAWRAACISPAEALRYE